MIQVGNHLPKGQLVEFNSQGGKSGPQIFNVDDAVKGKKIAILALPRTYSRSAVKRIETCKEQGVDEVWCLVGQDPGIVAAWRKELEGVSAKIRLVSDGNGVYVQALGLSAEAGVGGNAAYHTSLLADNGVVKQFDVDGSFQTNASNDSGTAVKAA